MNDWGFKQFVSLHEALDPSLGFLVNDALKLKVKVKVDSVLAHQGHQTEAEDGCRCGEETPTAPSSIKPPSPKEFTAFDISMAGTDPAEVKRCRAHFRSYIICWPSEGHIAFALGAKSKRSYINCELFPWSVQSAPTFSRP